MSETLAWPLRRSRQQYPREVGVVDAVSGGSLTYAELGARVDAVGALLDRFEVPPGGRVGVLALNSPTHLELTLGVPAAGRVIVSLNTRLAVEELAAVAQDAELSLLIADAAHEELAATIECPARVRIEDIEGAAPAGAAPAEAASPDATDLAALSYTGGTTGRAKGVMLSHRNLLANARHNLIATGHAHEDRWLHVCPMFHVAGTANVVAATWVGARQVVLPRFDAAQVCAAIEGHAITHLVLVPTMIAMLLDHEERHPSVLGSLRHLQYAASPIAPALQERLLARLPDVDVAQFYGMTEAAPTVTTATPADHRSGDRERMGSIGAPVVGVEVDIRDPVTLAALGTDEIGEIWVRGDNVMLGYWRQPEATAAAMHDGWYRTGDAASRDEDGYLHLADRLKDMIISGGENVYSVEVEAALAAHPAVAEAAVFGVPHDQWGEAVHAVVVARPGTQATAESLTEHCRRHIAGFKVPRTIDVTDVPLPKSGAGKVLKAKLRERARNISQADTLSA